MKTYLIALLLCAGLATGQTVNLAEYYIDSDPGPGNGTAIPVTAGGSITKTVNVPANVIAQLSTGTHLLVCRARDSEGDWSVAFAYPFYKSDPAPSGFVPNITAAEYFIDADPGPGNGTAIPVTAGQSVSQTVDVPAGTIAALADGLHLLVCRVRDAEGDWSVAFSYPFHKSDPPAVTDHTLARIDYRWYQGGSPVSPVYSLSPSAPANPVSFQQLASLAGLSEGQSYQLVFTPFDETGMQGISATNTVLVQTTDTNGDGIPDQWALQHGFGINDDIAGLQSDDDGLTNLEEFLAGTNPRNGDTDMDGMNDKAELDLTSLGFDPLVPDAAMVNALRENANNAGLFSKTQLQALSVTSPFLERDSASGKFTVTMVLKRSTDLDNFSPFPLLPSETSINAQGELEFEFTPTSGDVEFYRVEGR
jgi:hypothetical protein